MKSYLIVVGDVLIVLSVKAVVEMLMKLIYYYVIFVILVFILTVWILRYKRCLSEVGNVDGMFTEFAPKTGN